MQVNEKKLLKALEYINEINRLPFTELDLTNFGIDLTQEQKTKLYLLHSDSTSNVEMITGLVLGKIKLHE